MMQPSPTEENNSPFILCSVLIFIFAISWYIQFRWRRRRTYELLGKIKQPPGNPFWGQAGIVFGSHIEVFNTLRSLFVEYGPNFVMWLSFVPLIVVSKPEDLQIIMQSQSCIGKSFVYDKAKTAVGEGLFTASVDKWRKNRKIIQPTFNSKVLNTFVSIFAATSTVCVNEVLPKLVNKKNVNWYAIFTATNLDSISQTAMGVDTDAQRKVMPFGKHLERGLNIVFRRMTNAFLFFDIIFKFTNLSSQLTESVDYGRSFTYQVLSEKKEKFKKELEEKSNEVSLEDNPLIRKPLLELLLELDHKGMKFTDEELVDEIITLFIGGTDTSAVTSCFFLTMMGMHQDIQQKVYEEIIDAVGPDRTPDINDLNKLDLLERCLKETMRVFSPAPLLSRDVRDKEVVLSDCTLPVGAILLLPIFHTHRCSDYWDDPLKFDPDRFLPEATTKRHPYAFLPFSGGLRGCVGMRYSYMNLKMLQSMILRKYKVFCDYKSIEEIELMNCIVIRPVHGFKFHLEERK